MWSRQHYKIHYMMFYWILQRIPSKKYLSREDREVKAAYKNVRKHNFSATCSPVSLQLKVNQFPFLLLPSRSHECTNGSETHILQFLRADSIERHTVEPANTRGLLVFNKASPSMPCQWHIASLTLLALCILTAFSKWQRVKVFLLPALHQRGLNRL